MSTAEAAPGRVGDGEQKEARPANGTSKRGPHLELVRLRLTSWSKSDLSIAETTWPTYPYIYQVLVILVYRYTAGNRQEKVF